MKILHIAVHLGGGVGAVIDNLIKHNNENIHTIGCLNPNDSRSVQVEGAYHNLRYWPEKLNYLIKCNDIVLLHWYNNPLLYEFLCLHDIPECRLVIWSHSNCLNPPYVIPERLVDICDRFIFTSPVSYQAKEYQELSDKQKQKFDVIWSVSDLTKFYNIKKVLHGDTFNVGYCGTIDFNSKLHPDFVSLCADIDIPNVKFIVCGGGPDLELLKEQIQEKGLTDKFVITGQLNQDELLQWYAQMDVFGYPLYEKHIGTCEQVIGEAMAAGVVPVVLDNEPEKFIIDDSIFELKVELKEHYSKRIEVFNHHNTGIMGYSKLMRKKAQEIYSTSKMLFAWQQEFTELMWIDKSKKSWYGNNVGSYLFKESLGKYAKPFNDDDRIGIVALLRRSRQWFSESKGSIKQYAKCYPEDKKLKEWEEIL